MPIAADVARDGSIVVADFAEPAVHFLNPAGKRTWSIVKKGSGPGDVLRPYRVALGDSTVWIYDYTIRDVTVFTRSGKFLRRIRPSIALTTVDDIVAIGDTLLAILGPTRQSGYENKAIHMFDENGTHQRSFGEIAFAVDRTKLGMSGTGTLSRTSQNTLLYVRKGPFQLAEYSADGKNIQNLTPPVRIPMVVDSLTRIDTNDEGKEKISSRANEIRYPVRAVPLSNGFVLSGISDRGALRWWIQSSTSAPEPVTLPSGYSPTAWNSKNCEIVMLIGGDDEPALAAVDVRTLFSKSKINSMGCKR
jgi:hypothetical protein